MRSFVWIKRGQHDFSSIDFEIKPHALQANLVKESGAKANFLNLSKGINAIMVKIKVPLKHWLFNKQYRGKLVITHDWSRQKNWSMLWLS